jgi:glycerophosphoryl diester phosphodiesterase
VIAHRGASREAPENSLRAFARAVALGAQGIELDVHATADGVVVCHHDPDIDGRPIAATPAAALAGVTVQGEPVPTLAQVFATVGDRLTVYVELKGAGVVERAAPLCAAHRGPVAVHAFDHRQVLRAAELAPGVPRGILVVSRLVDSAGALRAARATTLWPHWEYVDSALVDEVHAAGGGVIVWTANAPVRTRLGALPVDAWCCDDVGDALGARG